MEYKSCIISQCKKYRDFYKSHKVYHESDWKWIQNYTVWGDAVMLDLRGPHFHLEAQYFQQCI